MRQPSIRLLPLALPFVLSSSLLKAQNPGPGQVDSTPPAKPVAPQQATPSSTLPEKQGLNRLWRDCKVRFAKVGGTEQTLQLFASIIERQGRFKILSYANAF